MPKCIYIILLSHTIAAIINYFYLSILVAFIKKKKHDNKQSAFMHIYIYAYITKKYESENNISKFIIFI